MTTAEFSPRLHLLGRFRLEYGAAPVDVCADGRRLLAYLGLRRRTTRAVLAGVLWPDVTEERAHGRLRTTLWRLHRGHRPIVHSDQDMLSLATAVSVDAHALAGSALRVVGSPECLGDDEHRQLLIDGDLLPGWDEDWVVLERERLRQLRLHALDALAGHLIARGHCPMALHAAMECVRIEPLRESAHRAVVSAHLAEGNVAEAVAHYRAFQDLLHQESGLRPSARFRSMLPPPVGKPLTSG